MAEPVSAFPNPTPAAAPVKGRTVPWPTPVEPLSDLPEISGRDTETADFSERMGAGVQDYYSRIQRALSDMVERSRRRFRYMTQERPMQIVIGVAVASLLTGAALRIWRSHHD